MNIKRLLEFYLDMSKPFNRLVRRAAMIGILTGLATFLTGYGEMNPAMLPLITGALAMIDKGIREYQKEQEDFKRIDENSKIDINRR